MVRSAGLVPKTSNSVPLIALVPDIEDHPGCHEKTEGLTDVATHALRMLQRAQPSLHLPSLNLLARYVAGPGPPAVS